jgi:hypothetical protein
MAGYSSTPLAQKLGIKPNGRLVTIGAPGNYAALVEPLPAGVTVGRRTSWATDIVHLFVTRRSDMEGRLPVLIELMRPDTAIWVSWPKKTAKASTDVTEQTIRDVALPLGLVDVKVCAVDDVWSALKLVIRKDRR